MTPQDLEILLQFRRRTITAVEDRYDGAYSGAYWLAFWGTIDDIPSLAPWADDSTCQLFWQTAPPNMFGRGPTVSDAIEDLMDGL